MITTIVNGLDDFQEYLTKLPGIADQAAAYSLNTVAGGTGLSLLKSQMYDEIEFPNGYLNRERLGLAKRATVSNLEATIKGRDRPTSLARFAQKPSSSRAGLTVQVKRNSPAQMKGAWLVPLNSGNMGLAVRLKPGERLNKYATPKVQLAPDVYLLYGPSVDQVLNGVAADKSDDLGRLVSSEFLRQIARLTRD